MTMNCRGTYSGSAVMGTYMYVRTETVNEIRMVINSNTANILALRLKTDGSAVFGVSPLTVVSTTYTSDQSLKENIEDASLADCLNLLENLKIRTFQWKRDKKKALGVIAQEVQPFLPADGKFDLVSRSNYLEARGTL